MRDILHYESLYSNNYALIHDLAVDQMHRAGIVLLPFIKRELEAYCGSLRKVSF
jgi:hypothetical protein